MAFVFIAAIGVAIGALYYVNRTLQQRPVELVSVNDAVDGRTVEVSVDGRVARVVLAGIGFPPNDDKAMEEAVELIREVAVGRKLNMEIYREVEGLRYVALKSSNGDSLNELMLKLGMARYESQAVGFISSMVEMEREAKSKAIGIWDKHRELFRSIGHDRLDEDEALSDSRLSDEFDR